MPFSPRTLTGIGVGARSGYLPRRTESRHSPNVSPSFTDSQILTHFFAERLCGGVDFYSSVYTVLTLHDDDITLF